MAHQTIYCMNLAYRKDRWEATKREVKKLGSEYSLIRVDAIQNKEKPWLGHAQTFIKIIRMAQEKKLPAVLIGEDDMGLCKESKTVWEKGFKELPDDWDIYLGGIYYCSARTPISSVLSKIGDFACTHFILIRAKAYDKIIAYENMNQGGEHLKRRKQKSFRKPKLALRRAKQKLSRQKQSKPFVQRHVMMKFIDRFMGYLSETGTLHCYVSSPMISTQRDSYSDIAHVHVNRNGVPHCKGLVFLPKLLKSQPSQTASV